MEKKMFLLADDDVDDREMFCEALHDIDSNILCHLVADGRELLLSLDAPDTNPQLIFLDINMPVMDGWQCLRKLKEDARHKDIPVVIISTSSHQREIDIAKDLGAVCYFTKPPQFQDLTQVLRTMVANLGPHMAQALQKLNGSGAQYVHLLAAIE